MRIKSHWFATERPKSPEEIAGAAAFIAWRIGQDALKTLRAAGYYLPAGPRYFAFVTEIDALDLAIKFHRAEITRCVKKADDPQLELKLEPPDPEAEQLPLNPDDKPKKKRAGDEPIDPSKPVGRVPKTKDPLDVPLGELDLRQDLRSKLAKTTFKSVRELARAMDAGKNINPEELLNMDQNEVVAVKRAVQAMRDATQK